jgi:thymidylate synthase (FAD)
MRTEMNVKLIAHTKLSPDMYEGMYSSKLQVYDGQAVALTAIRTCYSPGLPSEIVDREGQKYFGNKATDGEGGTEYDRLARMIVRSGHTSTLEHINFTFAIEGVSRALLGQLTRHRHFSFSVQSQRYVKFGSGDKSGGFDYVVPEKIANDTDAQEIFDKAMGLIQYTYDKLREAGIPSEDARSVLPQASACNLTMTANLRGILDFYGKRKPGRGAQSEITWLAELLRDAVVKVEPWTNQFFEEA